MKSLYRTILLWFALLLAASAAVIFFASPASLLRLSGRGGPLDRLNRVFLSQAREALRTNGAPGLRAYLDNLEAQLPARYFLLDPAGRDLVTGEDRAALLHRATASFVVRRYQGRLARAFSANGFHLVALISPERNLEEGGPYLLLVAAAVALLSWLFAAHLASPVRSLARTMERFGRGDMTARTTIQRRDEIGDLARSFNQMADRIASLVASERRLFQDVSHELQSPLARLAVAARLTRTDEDRDRAAARIQKEIGRLSEMVAGLLDLSRAEGDPANRRRDAIDLKRLVRGIADDCEWEAGEKNCTIEAHLEAATITGDEELLRRAIENVLRNAVRFSPAGAAVEVSLTATAEIAVRDYGPGVPEDLIEKIFQPFYRVEAARERTAGGGAGLGLSLARRAVDLHQGTIQAANANPGLRVTIRLHTS